MKKTTIGVLMGLFLLSISATAQADLSPNLIQNNGFETTTGDPIKSGTASGTTLISGQWYSWWSTGSPKWDSIYPNGGYAGSRYPRMSDGTNFNDYLVQSFQISSVWPGHLASAGPVTVSLWYKGQGANWSIEPSYVSLYGSNTQPTYGTYQWSGDPISTSGYGTLLGTFKRSSDPTTGFPNTSTWTQITLNLNPTAGYQWYTLEISGILPQTGSNFFGVDNASVTIQGTPATVPIPSAVWLLGAGLLGIAGIRRRVKEQRFK